MKHISVFVKFNNYTKLEENYSMIKESNYCNLISKAVTYHSKECFDILIKHKNNILWLNKNAYQNNKLLIIYENYHYGANKLNEYYLTNIIELSEYINKNILKFIFEHKNIFEYVFNKINKNKNTITTLLINICKIDDELCFLIVHKYLIDNLESNQYYNNDFIKNDILYYCLKNSSIKIIRELHKFGYNLSKIQLNNLNISSLIIVLENCIHKNITNITNITNTSIELFKFLLHLYPEIDQNLLWCNFLYYIIELKYYDCYLKLNFNWKSNTDFEKIFKHDNYDFEQRELNINELSHENLLNLIRELDYVNNENNFDFNDYIGIIKIINFLQEIKKQVFFPNAIIEQIVNIPELNLMEISIKIINSISNRKRKNYSSKYRRSYRRQKSEKSFIKENNNLLLIVLNVIRYLKENNLSNFNPLHQKYFTLINKNKLIKKKIVLYLINLSFVITDDFNKNIIVKLFNKKEIIKLKELYLYEVKTQNAKTDGITDSCVYVSKENVILNMYNLDNFKFDIKKIEKIRIKKKIKLPIVNEIANTDSDSEIEV
jgi:hypothetical protein